MSSIEINWDADLHPSKSKNAPKTKIVFPWSESGKKPDIYKDPCLLIIHK